MTAEEPFASDHRSFYSKKIPSVLFTTGRYPEHNTLKDTESIIEYEQMERELEYIYNFTRFLCNQLYHPVRSKRKTRDLYFPPGFPKQFHAEIRHSSFQRN